jgi:hypothetical protein
MSVEIKMAITLRYLAGGEYLDIREMWSIRTQPVYAIIEQVIPPIAAIKNPDCPSLEDILKIENHSQKSCHLHQIGMGFAALTSGVFKGCAGCIDGLCIRILRSITGTALPRVPRGTTRRKVHSVGNHELHACQKQIWRPAHSKFLTCNM